MGWQKLLQDTGFVDVEVGSAVDTFGEAGGEEQARQFEVYGFPFQCRKPT